MVVRAVGDQRHRRGVRDHLQELGQHGFADRVDPVRVFKDVEHRLGARQRHRVDQRGQPPPPRGRVDGRQLGIRVTNAQQVVQQYQILRVDAVGNLAAQPRPRGLTIKIADPADGPQQPRHHMKRDVTGMRLTKGRKHLDTTAAGDLGGLVNQPALADARRSPHTHHTSAATDRSIQDGCDGAHFPLTSHQRGLKATDPPWLRRHPQQPPRGHRILGALDVHHLRLTQHRRTLDQPRRRLTEHYPTRRRHRLHPLRQAHLLTNRGVTPSARTDLTGNDLTGIEAYPQPQVHTVDGAQPQPPAA